MKALRLFYAVKIPRSMVKDLSRSRDAIRDRLGGRPVRNDMLHITLHFIGNTDPAEIKHLAGILDDAATSMGQFQIEAGGFGSFRQRNGSLVYAAVSIPDRIMQQVVSLKKKAGTGDMKSFKPHITLLRNVHTSSSLKERTLKEIPLQSKAVISELNLMESIFHNNRPEYRVLHTSSLPEALID